MPRVWIELPDGALAALRKPPELFVREMRLAAAVKWYELGELSQERAAEIAGLSATEFARALARFGISPLRVRGRKQRQGDVREEKVD
jgi:predicted HTH domain antitoxin